MGKPILFITPDDYTSRWDRTRPVASPVDPEDTVAGREQQLAKDISASPDTLVSYTFHQDRRIADDIKSRLSTGDVAGAQKAYNQRQEFIAANRQGLLSLRSIQNAGELGKTVAANANYAVMGELDSEEVTMMGRKVKVGEILGQGNSFLRDQSEYVKDTLHFDQNEVAMYYGGAGVGQDGKPVQYDDVDRRMMKSIIDPFVSASAAARPGQPQPVVQNHMQLRSLAHTVAAMRTDIRAAFGSRSADVVDFVVASHSNSGGQSEALQSLVEIGKNMKGVSREDVADKIIASYSDLANSVFGPDKDGRYGQLSGDQRRLFDTALLSTVRYAASKGETVDFSNPRMRRAFKIAANEFALMMDYGVDLYRKAKDGDGYKSPSEALGEYIGLAAAGKGPNPGNLIQNMRAVRIGIQRLVTGGDDFEPATEDRMTGRAGQRNTVSGRLGGESSCPAADALASAAHEYLLQELSGDVVRHKNVAEAMRRRVVSRKGHLELRMGLAAQFLPSLHGKGAKQASLHLADAVINAVTTGDPMNFQDVITRASTGETAAKSPAVAKVFQSFVAANVSDAEFSDMRHGIVGHAQAIGMTEPEAQNFATQQLTMLHHLKRSGGNYRLQYQRLLRSGPLYQPVRDASGKPVVDEATGLARVTRTSVNYDDVTGGRYSLDPEFHAKFHDQNTAWYQIYRANLDARTKAAVKKAVEQAKDD